MQQQAFGQDRTNIDSSNAALQQMYDNYFRAQSANNQLQDSRFNQDAARYGMQTDARNSALQEMYQLRNQPINEISALLSGAVSAAGATTALPFAPSDADALLRVSDGVERRLGSNETMEAVVAANPR